MGGWKVVAPVIRARALCELLAQGALLASATSAAGEAPRRLHAQGRVQRPGDVPGDCAFGGADQRDITWTKRNFQWRFGTVPRQHLCPGFEVVI